MSPLNIYIFIRINGSFKNKKLEKKQRKNLIYHMDKSTEGNERRKLAKNELTKTRQENGH